MVNRTHNDAYTPAEIEKAFNHKGMRRFVLYRFEDPTGISGTGIVAEGCLFNNDFVALTWTTETPSLTWHLDMANVEKIHAHGGLTKVKWLDEE